MNSNIMVPLLNATTSHAPAPSLAVYTWTDKFSIVMMGLLDEFMRIFSLFQNYLIDDAVNSTLLFLYGATTSSGFILGRWMYFIVLTILTIQINVLQIDASLNFIQPPSVTSTTEEGVYVRYTSGVLRSLLLDEASLNKFRGTPKTSAVHITSHMSLLPPHLQFFVDVTRDCVVILRSYGKSFLACLPILWLYTFYANVSYTIQLEFQPDQVQYVVWMWIRACIIGFVLIVICWTCSFFRRISHLFGKTLKRV
jgi:hypothetical protein